MPENKNFIKELKFIKKQNNPYISVMAKGNRKEKEIGIILWTPVIKEYCYISNSDHFHTIQDLADLGKYIASLEKRKE